MFSFIAKNRHVWCVFLFVETMKKVVGAIKNNILKKDMKLWILKLLHKGRIEELSVQCVLAENWNLEVDFGTPVGLILLHGWAICPKSLLFVNYIDMNDAIWRFCLAAHVCINVFQVTNLSKDLKPIFYLKKNVLKCYVPISFYKGMSFPFVPIKLFLLIKGNLL